MSQPHQQQPCSSKRCWSCRNPPAPRRRPAPTKTWTKTNAWGSLDRPVKRCPRGRARRPPVPNLRPHLLRCCSTSTKPHENISLRLYVKHTLACFENSSIALTQTTFLASPRDVHPKNLIGGAFTVMPGRRLRFCFKKRRLLRIMPVFGEKRSTGYLLRPGRLL